MSQLLLFGTGRAVGTIRVQRVTSDGYLRLTSEGDIRSAAVAPVDVITYRDTSAADDRVTSVGDRRILNLGIEGPAYFALSSATSDGAEPFAFRYQTDPWQPGSPNLAVQGGESLFAWAYITFSWSAGAQVRVTPSVDGSDQPVVALGGTLEMVSSILSLAQAGGALQRVSGVFPVPLVRALLRNGTALTRVALRGERLQLTIESTGPLGVGELMLDGIEIEFTPVRKAIYPTTVDSSGS